MKQMLSDARAAVIAVWSRVAEVVFSPAGTALLVLGLLVGSVALHQRFTKSRSRRFYSGRVLGIVGRKRAGKSLFVVWQAYRQLRYPVLVCEGPDKGKRTYGHLATNFTLDVSGIERKRIRRYRKPPAPSVIHVREWKDLLDLPKYTLCMIDEMALWCPARGGGQTLPTETAFILKQLGKMDIEIYWADQNADNVAVGLRRQTDFICDVRNMGEYHRASFYDQANYPPKYGAKPLWRLRYRRSDKWMTLYNTKELIRPAEGVDTSAEVVELTRRIEARLMASAAGPRASEAAAPIRGGRVHGVKNETGPGANPGPVSTDPTLLGGPDERQSSGSSA